MRPFLGEKMIKYLAFSLILFAAPLAAEEQTLLNVSYDPTRELYEEFNQAFAKHWKAETGKEIKINQSHGGSGKQARAVIDGLDADVVTLALAYDIDEISSAAKLIDPQWQKRLPHNSAPYTSTIVLVVRKGNPKGIRDWSDLTKEGVEVITPNPKTSGGARWNYLAAWAFAKKISAGSDEAAKHFMAKLFGNVSVLDTGARGSLTTFAERGIGDVLIAWENEAQLLTHKSVGEYEIIYPSLTILAEPSVSVVDKNAAKKGNQAAAEAYLKYLYSDEGQIIAAKNYYRPINPEILAKNNTNFPVIQSVTVDGEFGGWKKAQAVHFADGGTFDQIYQAQ